MKQTINEWRTRSTSYLGHHDSESRSLIVLLSLLLAFCFVVGVTISYQTPFWYDEICTVVVARQQGAAGVLDALAHAVDTNPPLFYLLAKGVNSIISDEHIAYRLPSVAGFLLTLASVYWFLARSLARSAALAGAAFAACTALSRYQAEARPYALLCGFVGLAMVAWQRVDRSWGWVTVLTLALGAAASLHYYSVLVWPAFVLAELAVWVHSRRFRVRVWIPMIAGLLPLPAHMNLLLNLRSYYGENFWAVASAKQILSIPNWIYGTGNYLGFVYSAAATLVVVYWAAREWQASQQQRGYRSWESTQQIAEYVLTLGLLWISVVAFVAVRIGGGGLTERYVLPMAIGGAVAAGFLINRSPGTVRIFLIGTFITVYGLSVPIGLRTVVKGRLLDRRAAVAAQATKYEELRMKAGMPVVVADGINYVPLAYYSDLNNRSGLFSIVDPRAALDLVQSDSVDLALLVLSRYYPFQVVEYEEFCARNPEFILVSTAQRFEWLPAKLLDSGATLQVLENSARTRIYRVTQTRKRDSGAQSH